MTTPPLLHINWTRYSLTKMPVIYCPTCKQRRRFLCQFQEWYGWDDTCLSCGDRWTDGGMLARPFAPHWRQDNIQAAKRAWAIYQGKKEAT